MYILPQALLKFILVPRAGVEPTTLSLGRICSIQLSYRGMGIILTEYPLTYRVNFSFRTL